MFTQFKELLQELCVYVERRFLTDGEANKKSIGTHADLHSLQSHEGCDT